MSERRGAGGSEGFGFCAEYGGKLLEGFYSLFIAAITNCHKLWLKQIKFVFYSFIDGKTNTYHTRLETQST